MMEAKWNNYETQVAQAKKLFLTYDQQELIKRCRLQFDAQYFYVTMLSRLYRIDRKTGNMESKCRDQWLDGNSFGEVMTILDWLCDSKAERYISGHWINIVTHGHYFHRNLQEDGKEPDALLFDRQPEAFCRACEAMGGKRQTGADICYTLELLDSLEIMIQLWHGDEEFAPRLRFLWDQNTTDYIRYETTWYATGMLTERIKMNMN